MAHSFDTSDPQHDEATGYRSHKLAQKYLGQMLQGADVSYNGFTFPPTIQAKATVVPEWNKARTSVKYHIVVLTLEAIITQADVAAFDPNTPTIDRTMDNVRLRLMQPCQPLSFTLQGFGSFKVQGNPPNSFLQTSDAFLYDVNFGPKPQVLEWEPMGGGLCARIQWLITACIPPCGPEGSNNGLAGILDLYYDVKWSIGDDGFLRRSISGGVELAATRLPNVSGVHASNQLNLSSNKQQYDIATAYVRSIFAPLEGYERHQDFGVSADKRLLTFSFTDEEVPAPQAYPVGALNMRLTERVSSSMDDAFNRWDWNLSGTINVPNSKRGSDIVNNKRLVFAAFGLIVRDRLDRMKNKKFQQPVPLPGSSGELPSSGSEIQQTLQMSALPTRLSVSNEIYGASISVDISYSIVCNPKELWEAIGFFDKIRHGDFTWKRWRNFLEQSETKASFIDILPNTEVVVDLCHPLVTQSPSQGQIEQASSHTPSTFMPVAPDEDSSWISYANKFIFKTTYYTEAGVPLNEESTEYYQFTGDPLQANKEKQLVIKDQPESSTQAMHPDLSTSSDPVTIVTMVGSASRVGYPINAPVLHSVGGLPVTSYGKDVIVPSSKPSGFVDKSGNKVNMHHLSWRRSYIIRGRVNSWQVNTSGHPQIFQ